MAEAAPRQNSETGGYLSSEHKQTFTVTVGILGVLFFLAQFAVPLITMLAMPSMMFSRVLTVRETHPSHGAYWQGKVWYPEAEVGFDKTKKASASYLTALSFLQQPGPQQMSAIPFESPWLLAGTDRLWVIGAKGVGYYKDGPLYVYPEVKTLGDISRPFLYRGLPALIENRPDSLGFMVFRDNAWQEEYAFQLLSGARLCCINDLQILSQDGTLHVFLKYGDSLYYREGLNYDANTNGEDAWQAIAPSVSSWYAVLLDSNPAVFVTAHNENSLITGYRKTGSNWSSFFTHQSFITSDFGAFPLETAGRAALLIQGFPGSLDLVTVNGQEVSAKVRHGSPFPFPKSFMLMMLIPQGLTLLLPLLLAVIFSALMRKHRIVYLQAGPEKRPYASLTRRAFAQVIDAVILWAPLLVAGLKILTSFFSEENPFFMTSGFLPVFALLLGGLLWLLVCLIGFSIMEGRRGVTPGKWVFGIRVLGIDLQYCGFWRALVRNLLRFVDGFFNFLVGILVVALTEHWQRVGDLAARTVVVDVRKTLD